MQDDLKKKWIKNFLSFIILLNTIKTTNTKLTKNVTCIGWLTAVTNNRNIEKKKK